MNVRKGIGDIEAMRAFVETEFDDLPEMAEAMVAKLSLHLAECREEQQVSETWWKPRVDVTNEGRWIDGFSDDELRGCFRFEPRELRELMCLLEIPSFLWARGSARRFRGGDAFLLLLRRLAGREKGVHHAVVFDRSPPAISEMYNVVLHHVYTHAVVAICRELWEDELSSFAQALHGYGCPIPHCFGSVDATMFDNRCPFVRQKAMYNGRKRKHKVKYQGIVLANFMNGDWHVPANVHANDPTMLDHSRLVPRLKMMARRQGQPLCLDGNATYPTSTVLLRAGKTSYTTPEEMVIAERMSKYRQSVEGIFGS